MVMKTLTPETSSVETSPRRSRAVVATAVAILVAVGAAIGFWAVTGDGGPVAAEDARIELTFTGDDASYLGDREIIEGPAEAVLINDSSAPVWFILEYFVPGSAALNLDRYPEGTDFFPNEDLAGAARLMDVFEPGRVTQPIRLEPGTYIVEAAVADGGAPHVWRFAVIEVVSDGGSSDDLAPADVPSVSFREGDVPGVRVWQLPDSPGGYQPDQSWLAVGSDPDGNIYVSGHDHLLNSMLYRLDPDTGSLTWVGDARTASSSADNWEPGETAEKFHTRPTYHDGRVYVATLDKSSIDDAFLSTRGFHWYAYDLESGDFVDLSADEPDGVGAKRLQVVTISADSVNNRIYGMTIPENRLLYYDVAQGQTTVVGTPDRWKWDYFYSNRFMWTDSRGSVYMTGGTERSQWNQGENRAVLDSVWRYTADTGFEDTGFALEALAAIEVGQWNSAHDTLYVSDDMGHIYRFIDATATWEYIGRPDFPAGETSTGFNKVWVFQLDPGEETIYLGRSDNSGRPNEIWEFDIDTGRSSILAVLPELDALAGSEAFITGYDSWDDEGNFYISAFSMYDSENAYLIGLNPEQIR